MLRRTFTTSLGSTHQSDQEKSAIERGRLDLDLITRSYSVGDSLAQLEWQLTPRSFDRVFVRIEGEHEGRL